MIEEGSKQCRRCAEVKVLSEFSRKTAAREGLQPYCRSCARIFYVEHYKEHKQRIVVRNYEWTKRNRLLYRKNVWDYLLPGPCVDCGETDPVVLEFDHVRGNKVGNVSQMAHGECSLPNLMKEIGKCQVRCANCRRRKTALQFGWRQPMADPEGP